MKKSPRRRPLVVVLSLVCLIQGTASVAVAQKASKTNGRDPNGITVGRPKVFDNRTLTLMLDELYANLNRVSFFDKSALAAAFNLLQGMSETTIRSALRIDAGGGGGAADAVATDSTGDAAASEDGGGSGGGGSSAASGPPTLPTIPPFSSVAGFTPNFGESASDLLTDQVNLTYQVYNVRMLLERSLSDRLLSGEDKTRRQAVLGFNVSVDPPRTAEDSVAVVEITVRRDGADPKDDGLSLVSLMPQEKTYNAAAINSKANAFGGTAVAKVLGVGYNRERTDRVFYLYRDSDTISYERMSDKKDEVVFGWMFRPVLGRRSVSPGLRQLFAIVSLPADDIPEVERAGKPESPPPALKADVKTFWKKYDRDTLTSFEMTDANRAARVKYAFSLNMTKPEIFGDRYLNEAHYDNIVVRPTDAYQRGLTPVVDDVWWTPLSGKMALISVRGNNFFSGSKVTLGDKTLSGGDGLEIKSNQGFDIMTSIDALATGSAAILGRYGTAVPLRYSVDSPRLVIKDIGLGPVGPDLATLDVRLESPTGGSLTLNDLPCHPKYGQFSPIVTMNGVVIPPPYTVQEDRGDLVLSVTASKALLPDEGGVVNVVWPFLDPDLKYTQSIGDVLRSFQIVQTGPKSFLVRKNDNFGFRAIADFLPAATVHKGTGDAHCWRVIVGTTKAYVNTGSCESDDPQHITPISTNAFLLTYSDGVPEKIVLVSPENATFLLPVPKPVGEKPAAAVAKTLEVSQDDDVWITIDVGDPKIVDSAEARGVKLEKAPPEGATPKPTGDSKEEAPKAIQVHLTSAVTAKDGNVDITLRDKNGNYLTKRTLIIHGKKKVAEEGDKK